MVRERDRIRDGWESEPDEWKSADGDVGTSTPDGSPGQSSVTVISGIYTEPLPLANQTIGNVRGLLHRALNIDPQSMALVNGEAVDNNHELIQGDVLEFVRLAGEKG